MDHLFHLGVGKKQCFLVNRPLEQGLQRPAEFLQLEESMWVGGHVPKGTERWEGLDGSGEVKKGGR